MHRIDRITRIMYREVPYTSPYNFCDGSKTLDVLCGFHGVELKAGGESFLHILR